MEPGDIILIAVILALAGYLCWVAGKDHQRVRRVRKYYKDNNLKGPTILK